MNFSKSFLDDLRASTSLSDLIGEKVSWDQKKTRSGQGDYWAPCPFHEEKTASFHVDSNKGFYYCFGCHAKGDCFTFLKDFENLSFLDTVTLLARRSGISLPTKHSMTEQQDQKSLELLKIHQVASSFFEAQLKTTGAIACCEYLNARGITDAAIESFEIGFSPKASSALYDHLRSKNFNPNLILDSGLCIQTETGKNPFDRFRNRVMFPIKDIRGRIIAFGGRSLDTNARAKYLNSPETALFSKGKTVYNYFKASKTVKSQTPLLIVEGYMDAVALFQAGFSNVVAPLGTAITEQQLHLIWRLHHEPIVLFDGDQAGQNAVRKLLTLALPLLEAQRSLRFGMLPEGQDPDEYLNAEGIEGLNSILKTALPLVSVLWKNSTDSAIFDSPERKAALDIKLRQQVSKIKNSHLRGHFIEALAEIRKKFFADFKSNSTNRTSYQKTDVRKSLHAHSIKPLESTKNSFLGQSSNRVNTELRLKEGAIVLGAINHPLIAYQLEAELSRLKFKFDDLKKIRDAILAELPISDGEGNSTFHEKIKKRLKFDAIKKLKKIPHLKIHQFLDAKASQFNATRALKDAITRHNSLFNFESEIKSAEDQFLDSNSEALTSRIQKANKSFQKATKGSENEIFDNDELAKVSVQELQLMIKEKIWLKKK